MEISGKEIRIRGKLIRTAYLDGEGYQFLDDPEGALAALRTLRPRIDLFTFIQKLSDASPKHRYPVEMDNMAALRVSSFDDWMEKQLRPRIRRMVRKTAKDGLFTREVFFDDDFIHGIQAIYNESPIRQGRRFWHYRKGFEAVRQMNGTFLDRSIFIGLFLEDSLIGFIKLVTSEDGSQAGLMQILSMIRYQDKAPTNALIAQAVRSCADRGIRYLWYGNFFYGKKQHDSLAEFKRRNGFEKVELPRYYVPLTLAGRAALRLGLHRGLAGRIPEPVAATYRKIRSRWYALRFPGLENA